jgi:hypothetical protein
MWRLYEPTSSDLKASSEVDLCIVEAPYVPIEYCVNSLDAGAWTCVQPPNGDGAIQPISSGLQKPECNNISLVAFVGSETRLPSVSLPTSQGWPTDTYVAYTSQGGNTFYSMTPISSVVSSSPSSAPSGPTSLSKGLGIGLGVGIPLGIITPIYVAFWMMRRRKKRQLPRRQRKLAASRINQSCILRTTRLQNMSS